MSELELEFDKEFAPFFRSKSIDKIQEGLNLARSKGAFVYMPSPILTAEQSVYMPIVDTLFLREDEVYGAQGKFRIHFNGLLRMSIAASFEWSAIDCCRIDKQDDKMYCAFQAVGGTRKSDGRVYFHQAKDDIDIEVLEMEFEDKYAADWEKVKDLTGKAAWKKHGHKNRETFVAAMVRRDVIQKRKNMIKLAESGAKARVIRFILGLQSQYADKNKIIGMPFVFVYYAMNQFHDAVKPLMMRALPEAMAQVYGGGVADRTPAITHENSRETIILSKSDPIDQDQEDKPQDQNPNILDVNSISDFQGLPAKDQESWLKHYAGILKFDWEECIKDKEGNPVVVVDATQKWRDGFFNHVQKCSK